MAGPQVRGADDKAKSATKGAIRGLTADLVGGPVDLMQAIVNLGLAGGGFVGHKLGLLRTDQLPDPIEGAVGTSDWWVKNTPLEDDKSGAYTSGRIAANVLPALLSLAGMGGRTPGPRTKGEGQRGALYKDGDPEVNITRGTTSSGIVKWVNEEPKAREFYNPSWAMTREEIDPRFGRVHVVPKPERVEPRLSPTVLRNRDFYTQVSRQAAGTRNADLLEELQSLGPEGAKARLRDAATGRNFDRFGKVYAEGGVGAEGSSFPFSLGYEGVRQARGYPDLTQPYDIAKISREAMRDPEAYAATQRLTQLLSPRFQSLRHYGESPFGAKLLVPWGKESGVSDAADLLNADAQKFLRSWKNAGGDPSHMNPYAVALKLLQQDPKTLSGPGVELRQEAASILNRARTLPSAYGEGKTFGPFALNKDNILGIVTRGEDADNLNYVYGRQGIPVIDLGRGARNREVSQAVSDIQSFRGPRVGASGLKPLPILDTGHSLGPKSAPKSFSELKAPEGFVQSSHWTTETFLPKVVTEHPAYKGLSPEAQKTFDALYGASETKSAEKAFQQLKDDAQFYATFGDKLDGDGPDKFAEVHQALIKMFNPEGVLK